MWDSLSHVTAALDQNVIHQWCYPEQATASLFPLVTFFFLRVAAAFGAPRFQFFCTSLKRSNHMITSPVGSYVSFANLVTRSSDGVLSPSWFEAYFRISDCRIHIGDRLDFKASVGDRKCPWHTPLHF